MGAFETNKRNELLRLWAEEFNNFKYFETDPIIFPRRFLRDSSHLCGAEALQNDGKHSAQQFEKDCHSEGSGATEESRLADVEIAAVFACHLAWGRRSMIVRDLERLFAEFGSSPYEYILEGNYRRGADSCHRTIRWDEIAMICENLRQFYITNTTLEALTPDEMRTHIFGQKSDPTAANKKIHLMRRWMVRRDGRVDLGLWHNIDPKDLIIPLDVHVWTQATELGLLTRKSKDYRAAEEITRNLLEVFPDDPLLGDFALFGYGVTSGGAK